MNNFKNGRGIPFYYWFLGGLVFGLVMGWFFHGTISMLLRLLLLFGVIAVVILGVYLWQKASSLGQASGGASDIPEGNWRDIDPSSRK
jgi:hypothetical protein